MADVNKIVSHVLDVPGKDEVLVNYTDGTVIRFSLLEWRTIISKGKEAYTFICASEDYKNLIDH
jgi:hypothetical protein|tara:strand:+ start:264 stop:455 length:192 start_codon:yes stop_codon:yes gene_type:complete